MRADESRAYTTGFADGFKRGREDAIEEMVKRIKSRKGYFEEYYPNDAVAIAEANVYLEVAEQMKEEKNEQTV